MLDVLAPRLDWFPPAICFGRRPLLGITLKHCSPPKARRDLARVTFHRETRFTLADLLLFRAVLTRGVHSPAYVMASVSGKVVRKLYRNTFPEQFSGQVSGKVFWKVFPEHLSGKVSRNCFRGSCPDKFPENISGQLSWRTFPDDFSGRLPRTVSWENLPDNLPIKVSHTIVLANLSGKVCGKHP